MTLRPQFRLARPPMSAVAVFLGLALLALTEPPATRAQDGKKFEVFFSPIGELDGATSTDPKALPVRPNVEQPVYLYVQNTGATDEANATVRVLAQSSGQELARVDGITLRAGSKERIFLGKPAPMPTWQPLKGRVRVELLNSQKAPLAPPLDVSLNLRDPSEYVGVEARYNDAQKRIDVVATLKDKISGPPPVVRLQLTSDLHPMIRGTAAQGAFQTTLEGTRAGLYAEGIPLSPKQELGLIGVSVDNVERAFLFQTDFRASQDKLNPPPGNTPRLRLAGARYTRPGKYPVRVELDGSLSGTVELHVGLSVTRSEEGTIKKVLTGRREQQISVSAPGPDGSLLIKTSVSDWKAEWDLSAVRAKDLPLTCKVFIRAGDMTTPTKVLSEYGADPVDEVKADVSVDDTPPDGGFLPSPKSGTSGKELEVVANALDGESGIKDVVFFVGKPVEAVKPGESPIPKEGVTVRKGEVGKDGLYRAKLQLPKTGEMASVTVVLENNVGLTRIATAEVALETPTTAKKDDTNKKDAPIHLKGTVFEGERPQEGQVVKLTSLPSGESREVKANAKGEFRFEKVAPGKYIVSATKESSRRKAAKAITIEAGKTPEAVELLLLR